MRHLRELWELVPPDNQRTDLYFETALRGLQLGDQDGETPPEMGMRLSGLMPRSRLYVLRGFDHWSLLTDGRHLIIQRLSELLEQFG